MTLFTTVYSICSVFLGQTAVPAMLAPFCFIHSIVKIQLVPVSKQTKENEYLRCGNTQSENLHAYQDDSCACGCSGACCKLQVSTFSPGKSAKHEERVIYRTCDQKCAKKPSKLCSCACHNPPRRPTTLSAGHRART